MNSIENLQWRYATKKFDPNGKLTASQMQLLEQAFNLTATSYGLQPCRMVIVQNKILQEKMMPMAYGQRQVLDAAAVLVICITDVDGDYITDYFDRVVEQRNTDRAILDPFEKQLQQKFGAMDVDQIKAWATNQAYITLGTLLTVCAQHQIDSCPMEGFIPENVDELLELRQQGLQSVLLLPVGKRAADDPFASMAKVRLATAQAIRTIY
jgi:nitroreductase